MDKGIGLVISRPLSQLWANVLLVEVRYQRGMTLYLVPFRSAQRVWLLGSCLT